MKYEIRMRNLKISNINMYIFHIDSLTFRKLLRTKSCNSPTLTLFR